MPSEALAIPPAEAIIPLAVPNIGAAEEAAVLRALRAGWVSSVGPDVGRFEAGVARVSGTRDAVAVASGTAAITIALRALGIGAGDRVLCPTYTFIATANAISAAGATPVFVDIDPATWAMDPARAADAIARLASLAAGSAPPRALIVVLPMGNAVDLAPYRELCAEHGMRLVVDAAAAIGASWDGAPIGLLADATTFSFNGNKTITTGGGGAVVGPDDLVARARHLASTGRVGRDYDHDVPAFNERMTNLEAALGTAQLARLPELLAAKRRVGAAVDALAAQLGLGTVPRDPRAAMGQWFSALVLDPEGPPIRQVVERLNALGVGARVFWKPMHRQAAYADVAAAQESTEACPVADELWRRVLPLPSSTGITDAELDRVRAAVHAVLGAGAARS